MSSSVNLLNSNIGLGSVMNLPESEHLPQVEQIVVQNETEVKLDELYKGNSFSAIALQGLEPKLSSNDILQPANLNRSLNSIFERMQGIKDADVRRFLREDLSPLMENRELLKAYLGMMVEG